MGRRPADPASVLDLRHYIELAQTAERGVLDSIFLPDSPGVAEFRSEYLPGTGLDPLQLLSSGNFGGQPHPPAADRYERAGEYVEVVLKLWDAWEDDAAVTSRQTGQWAAPARLHPPRHHGKHFDVSGYLPFPRSPQGHPFLTQAGSSPPGVALAARYADAVFTPLADIAAGVAFRQNLRSQAAGNGREPGHIRVLPGLSVRRHHPARPRRPAPASDSRGPDMISSRFPVATAPRALSTAEAWENDLHAGGTSKGARCAG